MASLIGACRSERTSWRCERRPQTQLDDPDAEEDRLDTRDMLAALSGAVVAGTALVADPLDGRRPGQRRSGHNAKPNCPEGWLPGLRCSARANKELVTLEKHSRRKFVDHPSHPQLRPVADSHI